MINFEKAEMLQSKLLCCVRRAVELCQTQIIITTSMPQVNSSFQFFVSLYNLNLKYFFCAEYTVPGTDDAKDWMEVLEAMEIMELSQGQKIRGPGGHGDYGVKSGVGFRGPRGHGDYGAQSLPY